MKTLTFDDLRGFPHKRRFTFKWVLHMLKGIWFGVCPQRIKWTVWTIKRWLKERRTYNEL